MTDVEVRISEDTKRHLELLQQVEQMPDIDSAIRHLLSTHPPIRKVKPITWDDLPPKLPARVAWTKADKKQVSKYQ